MLDLYILETCPYCRKVMDYMKEHNIEYNKKDAANSINANKLLALGGIDQVPFLYNDKTNEKIYDSNVIISYLENYNRD